MADDDTLSCKQAGELLGRAPGTVAAWCARGFLPGATRTGRPAGPGARVRAWRIPREALVEVTGSSWFLTAPVTPPHGPRKLGPTRPKFPDTGKAEFRAARRAAEPEPGDRDQAEGKAPPRPRDGVGERVERDPFGFRCPGCGQPLVMERRGDSIRCRECDADLELAVKRQAEVVFRVLSSPEGRQ